MILENMSRRRRYFNVNDKKDIASAKFFFTNYTWRNETTCPYILEYPFTNVPDMIRSKLIHKLLGIKDVPSQNW